MKASMTNPLTQRGRCHVFGDGIPLDEGVMAFKYAIGRITDPEQLIPHLFEDIDPTFAARVQPGDFVIAGRDFGCGKPHIQGFIAMAALHMGVMCTSMPYKAMRGAISKGLPVLTGCEGATEFARNGDDIEVNFATGQAINHTQGTHKTFPAMPIVLQNIIAHGGAQGQLSAWLDEHAEQRAAAGAPSVMIDGTTVHLVRKAVVA
jgi:3-isopropylmalate/(R)-2-methylmalate dehydratase small subunit